MKVMKPTPAQLAGFRSKPKINPFWENYFQQVSIEFSQLFFSLFREQIIVKSVGSEIKELQDYFSYNKNSFIQFFHVYPHASFGFYNIPYETLNLLLTRLMGGRNPDIHSRDITHVDRSIIEIVTDKLSQILEKPFLSSNREIVFEFLDLDEKLLINSSASPQEYICVQQYILNVKGEYYTFDLAFTHNFLNRFEVL